MAGSAVNLSGMLSQMANSMGSMGQTVGSSMFNPMIEMQKENYARKEAERVKAEELARQRAEARAISQPMMQAQRAIGSDDARLLAESAGKMQEAGIASNNMSVLNAAAEMQGKVTDVRTKGALKGIRDIDKSLAKKDDFGNNYYSQELHQVMSARREQLMATEGVPEALAAQEAAQDKARDEVTKRKLDIAAKEDEAKNRARNAEVDRYVAASLKGLPEDKIPALLKTDVIAGIRGYKEDEAKLAEIGQPGAPLPPDVVKWAKTHSDPFVRQAAENLKPGEGAVGANTSYRNTLKAAWKNEYGYRETLARENAKTLATAASSRKVETVLKESATNYGLGSDVLETLMDVDEADRETNPLWVEARAIAEANSELTGRELASRIVDQTRDSFTTEGFDNDTYDAQAVNNVVGNTMRKPSVAQWASKNPNKAKMLQKELMDEVSKHISYAKATAAGKQVGRNDVLYDQPFSESVVLRNLFDKYKLGSEDDI